ncbi:MAG: WD40 repeat domain-containing protein [Steroidobacteraceae bacterium]
MNAPAARLERRARVELGDFPVDAAWSPDGRTLLVAVGEGALLWIAGGEGAVSAQSLGVHAGGALAVAWQQGGQQFASSGQDGEVRLWDARTREARVIHSAGTWSERLAWSSNGKLLAVATGRELRVFGSDGALRSALPRQNGVIAAIAWRGKTNELASVGNGGANLHRLEPQPVSREFPWQGACLTASWSPDGRVLASGMQDGSVHFWNVAAGAQSQMRGYGSKVALTSWSANSRLLATAADEVIIVWDFSGRGPEGSEPLQLGAHTARLAQLGFQPKGPLLAAGGRDHRLTLWRTTQPQQPVDADMYPDEVALLRWSNDGTQLAVADRSGLLNIYSVRG